MKRRVRYLIRLAKAITSDPRLPRGIRWPLQLAFAIKTVPFPDLGIDEVILVVVGLLVTVYRSTFRAIRAELAEA